MNLLPIWVYSTILINFYDTVSEAVELSIAESGETTSGEYSTEYYVTYFEK